MFGIPEEVLSIAFRFLWFVAGSLFIYFLKENLSSIKKLNQTMIDLQKDFAVHKEIDANVKSDVCSLKSDVADLQKGQVRTNLRVNEIATILKINKYEHI